MFASKETAILHFFAMVISAIVFRIRNLRGKVFVAPLHLKPPLAAGGTFVALLAILFTWFGRGGNLLPLFIARAFGFHRACGKGPRLSKTVSVLRPALYQRVVRWIAGRPRLPRVPDQHQKVQPFTLCSVGVLRAGRCSAYRLHSIQDPVARAEHLASTCILLQLGRVRADPLLRR